MRKGSTEAWQQASLLEVDKFNLVARLAHVLKRLARRQLHAVRLACKAVSG